MKSKFANLRDLKSVDGSVYENLAYYARVVAGKYGGKKEEAMKEHIIQMFKALDKIGVLQYVNQKELSKKVYEMYFDNEKPYKLPGSEAFYDSISNFISTRTPVNFGEGTFIHEFLHLMSTSRPEYSKKGATTYVSEDLATGGSMLSKCGFAITEWADGKEEVLRGGNILTEEEVVNKIINEVKTVTQDEQEELEASLELYNLPNVGTLACQDEDVEVLEEDFEDDEDFEEEYKQRVRAEATNLLKAVKQDGDAITIFLTPQTAMVLKPRKDSGLYDIKTFEVVREQSGEYDDYNMFNEGCTEFLSKLVETKINKSPRLIEAYLSATKYIACLYSVIGNDIYKGYFSNDMKPLADASGLTLKEFQNFAHTLEKIYPLLEQYEEYEEDNKEDPDEELEEEMQDIKEKIDKLNYKLHNKMTDILVNKIVKDLYENESRYNNARDIKKSVIACFVDYAKNLHFGVTKERSVYFDENSIFELVAKKCSKAVSRLHECAFEEESYQKLSTETIAALSKMKVMSSEEESELCDKLKYINDVEYFFIQPELKQINPSNYLGLDKKIIVRDMEEQNKIRSSKILPLSKDWEEEITYPNKEEREGVKQEKEQKSHKDLSKTL